MSKQLQEDFLEYVDRAVANFTPLTLVPFFRSAILKILTVKQVVIGTPIAECTPNFINECTKEVRLLFIATILKLHELTDMADYN